MEIPYSEIQFSRKQKFPNLGLKSPSRIGGSFEMGFFWGWRFFSFWARSTFFLGDWDFWKSGDFYPGDWAFFKLYSRGSKILKSLDFYSRRSENFENPGIWRNPGDIWKIPGIYIPGIGDGFFFVGWDIPPKSHLWSQIIKKFRYIAKDKSLRQDFLNFWSRNQFPGNPKESFGKK